jgi:hypothetical protein
MLIRPFIPDPAAIRTGRAMSMPRLESRAPLLLGYPGLLGRLCLAQAPRAHLRLIRSRLFRSSTGGLGDVTLRGRDMSAVRCRPVSLAAWASPSHLECRADRQRHLQRAGIRAGSTGTVCSKARRSSPLDWNADGRLMSACEVS